MQGQHLPNTLTLHIGKLSSDLWIDVSGADMPDVQLSVGWCNVLPGPLHTSPPKPVELEIAIQYIEDHVMPLARTIPNGSSLCVQCVGEGAPSLFPILQVQPVSLHTCHIDDIEAAFSRLCAIAEGRPVGEDGQLIVPTASASLLIVRELMHHNRLTQVLIT